MTASQLAAAEATLDTLVLQLLDLSERGAWSQPADLRMAGVCREVIYTHCWGAMQTIFRTSGSGQVRAGERLERVWRDFSQLYSHGMQFLYDQAARNLAMETLGVESDVFSPTFSDKQSGDASDTR